MLDLKYVISWIYKRIQGLCRKASEAGGFHLCVDLLKHKTVNMKITALLCPLLFTLSSSLIAEEVFQDNGQMVEEGPIQTESVVLPLAKSIQPRNEGAVWFYTSAYFEDGQRFSNGTSKEEIVEHIEIDGVLCWKVRLTMDWRGLMDRMAGAKLGEDDYDYFWEYFNEQGSYNYSDWGNGDAILTPKSLGDFELTLPYPTETGHRYHAEDSDWEVLDDTALIKVPAGEFTCVVYCSTDESEDDPSDDWQNRFYMAPGVGMVRWQGWAKLDGKWVLDMQDDLVKFDLNEADASTE